MDEKTILEWANGLPDHGPFYAYLAVESRELTLAELTSATGLAPSPDFSRDIGDTSPIRTTPFEVACWAMGLKLDPVVHPGTEGLSDAIDMLSTDLADRCADLAEQSCDVTLIVVQKLSDDPWSTGLHLTATALSWLARAHAEIDIDQYPVLGDASTSN